MKKSKKNNAVIATALDADVKTEITKSVEDTDKTLSKEEKAELKRLEKVVDKHKASFLEIAVALATINDTRLYRAHGTFAQYCEKRFDIKRAYAYKLMDAGKLHQELGELGAPLITNEGQARVLKSIDTKEQRAEVMQKAQKLAGEDAEIRGEHVTKAIQEISPEVFAKLAPKKGSTGKKIEGERVEKWLETISQLHKRLVDDYEDSEKEIDLLAKLKKEIEAALGKGTDSSKIIDIEGEPIPSNDASADESDAEDTEDETEEDNIPEAA